MNRLSHFSASEPTCRLSDPTQLHKLCHCSICNFFLNATCSKYIPPLTILHQKSHDHTLTFFPRRLPLPCDACGESLQSIKDVVYSCLSCNFMVHSNCVYLPCVIKITRHQHRLSYTSYLPPFVGSCGVCRKSVNINCGEYSCSKRCHYVVHSKCATRKDVWDGKDLERIPEEPEEYLEPFVKIDEETIQHFSHQQHHLKLHKNTNTAIFGETMFCEACCLPVPNSKAFFSCMECDFILDETCANLTRKKDHPLHKHSLILHPFSPPDKPFMFPGEFSAKGISKCKACEKPTCGFIYQCCEEDCEFQLDVRCASLPDALIHGCHPQDHPLFFNLTRGDCTSCGFMFCSGYYLECMICKSFLGLKCATIPSVAHYKHDRHPLILFTDNRNVHKTTPCFPNKRRV